MDGEGQRLTAEDQLFILMQAGQHLTATRGSGALEARLCYERAEFLSHSLNCPLSLYLALVGQWRHSLNTGKLSATMQIAKRLYALAQEQNDSSLILGAYNVLTVTLYFLGDFATARQYAMRGAQIRRGMQSRVGAPDLIAVHCLCFEAFCDWHIGKVNACRSTILEAISLAKEHYDMHGLADALLWAAVLGQLERDPAE